MKKMNNRKKSRFLLCSLVSTKYPRFAEITAVIEIIIIIILFIILTFPQHGGSIIHYCLLQTSA